MSQAAIDGVAVGEKIELSSDPTTGERSFALLAASPIAPVRWDGVRAEYRRVWEDFPRTSAPFGVTLTPNQMLALGHLLVSMDLIDSAIDRLPERPDRERACAAIVRWMRRETGLPLESFGLESDRLAPLREIVASAKIDDPFLDAAERVFVASEGKRNAASVRDLIGRLTDEGQAAAEMTVLIVGENTNAGLNRFLTRIMRIGTIVDTLLDADDDYRRGLLRLRPTRLVRWRLQAAIARRLPALILGFPDRPLLWRYCLSYTKPTSVRTPFS